MGWTLAMVVLITAACSEGRGSQTGATVPPGGETSTPTTAVVTTTTAVESYEVPEVIDQAYVQRVVSAYDKVLGDAIRVLKRDGAVTEEFLSHLLAIYTEPEFESQQRGWVDALAQGDLERRPPVPRDPATKVVGIARADEVCITVEIDRDFRPTLRDGIEPVESEQPDYLVLVRKRLDRDPLKINDTPWVLAFDGFKQDGTVPVNSCDD